MNKLILLSGLPGSGKSTLAEAMAQKLKLPLFSVDPIEAAIIKSGIEKSFETGLAAYLVAEALAIEQFKLGSSVVIDAVNAEEEAKNVWRDLAKKQNATLIIIECATSDTELHKKRIEARVRNLHGIPEITWERVEERRKAYTEWKEQTLKIDTANRLEANVDEAVRYIRQQAQPKPTILKTPEKTLKITFVETQAVKEGVTADLYTFDGDTSKDLAIVHVTADHKTPLQRILKGTKTIEGYMSGKGSLTVIAQDELEKKYDFTENTNNNPNTEIEVHIGELMQWSAKTNLTFYEICEPPYEDGRFEDLPE